jgi:hypothetical protein
VRGKPDGLYIRRARTEFCAKHQVTAPHEAISSGRATVLEWCITLEHHRVAHLGPRSSVWATHPDNR